MTLRPLLPLSLSTLMLGGSIAGVALIHTSTAIAGDRSGDADARLAAAEARKAAKALSRGRSGEAVAFAEHAVALAPRDAEARVLLGRSYMAAGRFASARSSFADALALAPGHGKAALNLALATIATGDQAAAHALLVRYADAIPGGDRGLALALAGDPVRAVDILYRTIRAGQATPQMRQNLALAYALAGQWGIARAVIATDLAPAAADARIEQWAAFAQPRSAADQVATLLGVTPVADGGQPLALALNAPAMMMPGSRGPVLVALPPAAPLVIVPAPALAEAPPAAIAVAAPPLTTGSARVRYAAARELAQPLPVRTIAASLDPARIPLARPAATRARAAAPALTRGDWYVQVGAYPNADTAQTQWAHTVRRFPLLGGTAPNGVGFRNASGVYYRLSVGGFAKRDAMGLCRSLKQRGGACFVRLGAGDQMASWARAGVQVAAR